MSVILTIIGIWLSVLAIGFIAFILIYLYTESAYERSYRAGLKKDRPTPQD